MLNEHFYLNFYLMLLFVGYIFLQLIIEYFYECVKNSILTKLKSLDEMCPDIHPSMKMR